jgi:hypothetical protein
VNTGGSVQMMALIVSAYSFRLFCFHFILPIILADYFVSRHAG